MTRRAVIPHDMSWETHISLKVETTPSPILAHSAVQGSSAVSSPATTVRSSPSADKEQRSHSIYPQNSLDCDAEVPQLGAAPSFSETTMFPGDVDGGDNKRLHQFNKLLRLLSLQYTSRGRVMPIVRKSLPKVTQDPEGSMGAESECNNSSGDREDVSNTRACAFLPSYEEAVAYEDEDPALSSVDDTPAVDVKVHGGQEGLMEHVSAPSTDAGGNEEPAMQLTAVLPKQPATVLVSPPTYTEMVAMRGSTVLETSVEHGLVLPSAPTDEEKVSQ